MDKVLILNTVSVISRIFQWNQDPQLDGGVGEDAHAPGPSGGGGHEGTQEDITGKPSRTASGTMILVIGIILGAFVGMLLIVIIVLKYRTGVDRTGMIKCEETIGTGAGGMHGAPGQGGAHSGAPRYQFAHPNDYGELGVAGGGNCERYFTYDMFMLFSYNTSYKSK